LERLLETLRGEGPSPEMTLYSQRDPRWKDEFYAGGLTFGQAGCYVCCVALIASLAGYDYGPPTMAEILREAECFAGGQLLWPERVTALLLYLRWDGRADWRDVPADLERLARELEQGPVIIETEFRPGGDMPPQDQHFVVAEEFTASGDDLLIADPWDGTYTRLLERYALNHWDVARAVYGMRLLRVA